MHTGYAFALALLAAPAMARGADTACERLNALKLSGVSALQAQATAAGPPPAVAPPAARTAGNLPTYCRVSATLTPSHDSEVRMELWLPAAGWNGKFLGVGNGGWSGSIAYPALIDGLQRGYATASTDTGHVGASASFALGHPDKLIDFGYRAVHEMTVVSKALVAAYYGKAQRHAYWNGCSAGGRQGLKEAQRYPEDYDGIVAGAPAADWTGRASAALRAASALRKDKDSFIAPEKYAALHRAALAACDGRDGAVDGLIENPRSCSFDPAVLACSGAENAQCLTPAQVTAARTIYAPARNPATGREIPSLYPGSELGWATWGGAQPLGIAADHFRYIVAADPAWNPERFDFDRDVARAEAIDADTVNALNADIGPFLRRGGKLLQYHGWSDPQISPGNSVQYYERAAQAAGGVDRVRSGYRLFMMPGMGHCAGGEGPDSFDKIRVLEQWVENGVAPDVIVASGTGARTRPLCPYPQQARYRGSGSIDDAANFACVAPAAILGMNHIYYRYLHLVQDPEYQTMPARLRMNVIGNPRIDKAHFELVSLAVSAVNGCGMCIVSHERTLRKHNVTREQIQSAVRIAATIHAVAGVLEYAKAA